MKKNPIDFDKLSTSLHYLYVSELKDHCEKLTLSIKGKKIALIARIIHFLKTGEKIDVPPYPAASIAPRNVTHGLTPLSLMLKGSYKNDLKTRLFFKKLIGEYFHFTAFGIDWLEERWMQGNPPTYQEFADMWVKEHDFRKQYGSVAKEEWAYINFVQRYIKEKPTADRDEIFTTWKIEREKHKAWVDGILGD